MRYALYEKNTDGYCQCLDYSEGLYTDKYECVENYKYNLMLRCDDMPFDDDVEIRLSDRVLLVGFKEGEKASFKLPSLDGKKVEKANLIC
jgi:hypothetical protein